jgi:hypothetical protein
MGFYFYFNLRSSPRTGTTYTTYIHTYMQHCPAACRTAFPVFFSYVQVWYIIAFIEFVNKYLPWPLNSEKRPFSANVL